MPNDPNPDIKPPPDRLLKRVEVEKIVGMGTTTIYRKINDGTFPRPVNQGTKLARWRESDVQAWIASLSVARPSA